jgi:hypothetical protein
MISGPFFIGTLVGVGCGMIVLGPRLGTLAGTMEPSQSVLRRKTVKYLGWHDAKNAKLRAERGIGFDDVVFPLTRSQQRLLRDLSSGFRLAPNACRG